MVAEKVVVENCKVLTVTEEDIKAVMREIMKEYRKEVDKIDEAAKILEPYYREIYLKTSARTCRNESLSTKFG